jgi:hypothetical protein
VPAEVLNQALLSSAVERHQLPPRLRVNRTHLVWSGEASVPLQALMGLLPNAVVSNHPIACKHQQSRVKTQAL